MFSLFTSPSLILVLSCSLKHSRLVAVQTENHSAGNKTATFARGLEKEIDRCRRKKTKCVGEKLRQRESGTSVI